MNGGRKLTSTPHCIDAIERAPSELSKVYSPGMSRNRRNYIRWELREISQEGFAIHIADLPRFCTERLQSVRWHVDSEECAKQMRAYSIFGPFRRIVE